MLAGALYRHVDGIRSQGGQPKKWIDNIKESIRQIQLNIEEAAEAARVRSVWKRLVASPTGRPAREKKEDF